MRNKYIDDKGRILYISHYYRGFATVYRKTKSRNFDSIQLDISDLPVRDTWEQAQADLDRYAEKKKLPAFGDDKTCKYFYGAIEQGKFFYKQCGTRAFVRYTDKEMLENDTDEICKGNHSECRAYCFRRLEELGFEPQSYWHTEDMQKIVREIETISDENNLLEYLSMQANI